MLEQDIRDYASTAPNPTGDELLSLIDFTQPIDRDLIGQTAVSLGLFKSIVDFNKRFAAAKSRARILDKLGRIPTTPCDLIELVLDRCGFTIDPTIAEPMTWVCPLRGVRVPFELERLREAAHNINRNILIDAVHRFRDSDIDAEAGFHHTQFVEECRRALIERVTQPGTFDWDKLCRTVFVQETTPVAIQAAILQKWVWQVKRKLHAMPVTYHVMPVIFGVQGCGKSEFINRLLAPLGSLAAMSDLNALSDNREVDLFRKYAVNLDEMSKASKAEIETIKTVITRHSFNYRPMGTNLSQAVTQNASFIGSSNKLLAQIVNDPTGNRRFFQLDFVSVDRDAIARGETPAHFAYLDGLDWLALWCSVDHMAADPSTPYQNEIAALQAQSRTLSSVEAFLTHVSTHEGRFVEDGVEVQINPTAMNNTTLYLEYRRFCAGMKVMRPFEKSGFTDEMVRLYREHGDIVLGFRRGIAKGVTTWRYVGPTKDALTNLIALKGGAQS